MKAVKSIGLFFVMGCGCIVIGYLLCMVVSRRHNDIYLPETTVIQEEQDLASSFMDVSSSSPFLRMDTEFIIEEVDIRKGTVSELEEILPEKYVGMDRESFLQCMDDYESSPPLSERQKGFVGLEVLSFSRDRVVVQKNYLRANPEDGYYLALLDYRVIVLFDDAKTIYMTTDISYEMLPQNLQEEIMNMIYVENEQALFDFLEAYTS